MRMDVLSPGMLPKNSRTESAVYCSSPAGSGMGIGCTPSSSSPRSVAHVSSLPASWAMGKAQKIQRIQRYRYAGEKLDR